MRRRLVLAAVAAVVVTVVAPVALAGWSTSVSPTAPGGLTLSTATLADPTSLAAASNKAVCTNNNAASLRIDLTWVATTSPRATGYVILRNGTQVGTVTGASSTSWSDTTGQLAFSTTYTYVVESAVQGWTSGGASATITTLSRNCK